MGEGRTELWGRITKVMRHMKWTEADLRDEIGISPQDVYNWKNRNETIGPEQAFLIQKKTKFFAQWLMYNQGPERMFELTPAEQRMVEESREKPSVRDAIYALLGVRPQ